MRRSRRSARGWADRTGIGRTLAEVIAERTGLDPEELEVRVHATVPSAACWRPPSYWFEHGHRDDFADLADRALDVSSQHGLPTVKGWRKSRGTAPRS